MKKLYFLMFSLLIISLNSNAQAIPNNTFETWITYPGTSTQDPLYWLSSNLVYESEAEITTDTEQAEADAVFGAGVVTITTTVPPSVVQTTGHSGTYAIKLQNVQFTTTVQNVPGNPDQSQAGPPAPAFATNYSITATMDTIPGVHVTSSPAYLNGYYKFYQGATDPLYYDTAAVIVNLMKWNSVTSESDSIGYGEIDFHTTVSTYTPFTVTIVNTSGMVPDTALIGLESSFADSNSIGTYLIVDDLAFSSTPSGIITQAFNNPNGIVLYPNPAINQATIKNLPENADQVYIMDYTGRKVSTIPGVAGDLSVNTSTYAPGLYFYNVMDNSGALLYSSRFAVTK